MGGEVMATSAATGAGLDELAAAITWRVPLEDARRDGARARCRPRTASTGPGEADQITRGAHRARARSRARRAASSA